jgi:hypothetical protein
LGHSTSPFCIGCFEIGSHFIHRLAWTVIILSVLLFIAGITGTYHCTHLLAEIRFHELFCPELALNFDHPDFCLLSRYRLETLCPSLTAKFLIGVCHVSRVSVIC